MKVELLNLLAIGLMALATYATRVSGLFVAGWIPQRGRARAALDAVPAAVLIAVIAPSATAGPAEMIAAAVTVLCALRLPLIATIVISVVTVVITRHLLG